MFDMVLHANAIERMIAELATVSVLFRSALRPAAALPDVPAIRRLTRRPWVTWRLRMLFSWLLPGPLLQWLRYLIYFGKPLPLTHPQTFTERLLVKMGRDRDPTMTRTADRIAMREYVEERIGAGHLPALLAVIDDPKQVRTLDLPKRYVAKATHGSQMVHIVQHDSPAERETIVRKGKSWLRTCYWRRHGEWAYRGIPRRIIIENFLGSDKEPPGDWKWYCFNGKAAIATFDFDRFTDHRRNVYDADGAQLDLALCHRFPQGDLRPVPENYQAMRQIAERLAEGFEFVRVDLYDLPEGIIVGELTHCPAAGLTMFNPPEWDQWLGERWAKECATRG